MQEQKLKKWKRIISKLGESLGNTRNMLECDNVSNHDIVKQVKNISGFEAVFALDEINHIPRECRVINFDESNKKGSHWGCYYKDKNLHFKVYFDSSGKTVDTSTKIVKFLKISKKKIKHNDSVLQQFDSLKCGCFCIYYIKERNEGKKPLEVLNSIKEYPSEFTENKVQYHS